MPERKLTCFWQRALGVRESSFSLFVLHLSLIAHAIAGLWLTRRTNHPRLRKVETFGANSFGLHFRLMGPEDLDDPFAQLVREAYAVGCQEHLQGRKKGAKQPLQPTAAAVRGSAQHALPRRRC